MRMTLVRTGSRGQGRYLQAVERAPGVAFRGGDQMGSGVRIKIDPELAQSSLGIGQRVVDQGRKLGGAERFELENLRTRDERAVDVKGGIVRGRADQPDGARFHIGEKGHPAGPC